MSEEIDDEDKFPKITDTVSMDEIAKNFEVEFEPLLQIETGELSDSRVLYKVALSAGPITTCNIVGAFYAIVDQFLRRVPDEFQLKELQYIAEGMNDLYNKYIDEQND